MDASDRSQDSQLVLPHRGRTQPSTSEEIVSMVPNEGRFILNGAIEKISFFYKQDKDSGGVFAYGLQELRIKEFDKTSRSIKAYTFRGSAADDVFRGCKDATNTHGPLYEPGSLVDLLRNGKMPDNLDDALFSDVESVQKCLLGKKFKMEFVDGKFSNVNKFVELKEKNTSQGR